jgi:hypothetical protein
MRQRILLNQPPDNGRWIAHALDEDRASAPGLRSIQWN